jgi:hypothetical protein
MIAISLSWTTVAVASACATLMVALGAWLDKRPRKQE